MPQLTKSRWLSMLCLLSCLTGTAAAADYEEPSAPKALSGLGFLTIPTTFNYYLQDPSVMSEPGVVTIPVQQKFRVPILKDSDIEIRPNILPNSKRQFIFKPETKEFDSASVFATVRTTMDMYNSDLVALKALYPADRNISAILTYWNGRGYGKLYITPEAGTDANAYYNRDGTFRELRFFSFEGEDGKTIHTCRSSEIVAHETGHSILDILKSSYYTSDAIETGGFHESFGDLTALFWDLNHPRLCQLAIEKTKGNLHQRDNNFLAAMAEQFGKGLGMNNGLRNGDDDISISSVEPEVHAISGVFTGAIYDAMVDAFNESTVHVIDNKDKAVKLYDVGKQLRQMTLEAIVTLDKPDPIFSDFAHALTTVAKKRKDSRLHTPLDSLNWSTYFINQFTRRGVPVSANSSLGVSIKVSPSSKCRPDSHHVG